MIEEACRRLEPVSEPVATTPPPSPAPTPEGETRFTVWHGILLAEAVAVLIGLVSPLTPSKSGSRRDAMSELFFANPTYAEKFLVHFAATNALILILALIGTLYVLRQRRSDES